MRCFKWCACASMVLAVSAGRAHGLVLNVGDTVTETIPSSLPVPSGIVLASQTTDFTQPDALPGSSPSVCTAEVIQDPFTKHLTFYYTASSPASNGGVTDELSAFGFASFTTDVAGAYSPQLQPMFPSQTIGEGTFSRDSFSTITLNASSDKLSLIPSTATTFVTLSIATDATNYKLVNIEAASVGENFAHVGDLDFNIAGFMPTAPVTAVPLPSAVWMSLPAMGLVVLIAKRTGRVLIRRA